MRDLCKVVCAARVVRPPSHLGCQSDLVAALRRELKMDACAQFQRPSENLAIETFMLGCGVQARNIIVVRDWTGC